MPFKHTEIVEIFPVYRYFFKKVLHTAPQVCCQDVLSSNQKLLPEVCRFSWTVGEQLQHSFYHLLRIF